MNKFQIKSICEIYNILNYTVNIDNSIDVIGNVNLFKINLIELPLKFNKVDGSFYCSHNMDLQIHSRSNDEQLRGRNLVASGQSAVS